MTPATRAATAANRVWIRAGIALADGMERQPACGRGLVAWQGWA